MPALKYVQPVDRARSACNGSSIGRLSMTSAVSSLVLARGGAWSQGGDMFYDLMFNGYRLDHRSASKFDAILANNAQPVPEGFYQLGAEDPVVAFGMTPSRAPVCTASEYELTPIPERNFTCLRPYYLFDASAKALVGIRVDTTFFQSQPAPLHSMVLCVRYASRWMQTALAEVGQSEVGGPKANSRILEYYAAAGFWTTDDSGSDNAWCASFVSWVMQRHGYALPANAYRALEWKNFGKKIDAPVYGAIGIKSRTGGGHVAFVVGKSADGKYLFMLGGNQGDEVNVCRYDKSAWDTFVVPSNFDNAQESLPVYVK